MVLEGIDLAATREVSLDGDSGETKTVWVLGTLDLFTRTELSARAGRINEGTATLEEQLDLMTEYVRMGIRDIKNYVVKGVPIVPVFETVKKGRREYRVLADETLALIAEEHIMELFDLIVRYNAVDKETEKN